MKDINYKRTVEFIGRNGMFKQTGTTFKAWTHNKTIGIAPITSKGEVGRCEMEIPAEDIHDFINALLDAKRAAGVYMKHPVWHGESTEDAPEYKVISEGSVLDETAYPSYTTCRYDENLHGVFYWLDKDQPEYKNVCWVRFDVADGLYRMCTRDKDGNEVIVDWEYATQEVNTRQQFYTGTHDGVFRELVIDNTTRECCLIEYPETETEAEE